MSLTPIFSLVLAVPAIACAIAPGVLLAYCLFPHERRLRVLSIGIALGIVILGLIALVASYLPFGLTIASLAVGVTLLMAISIALFWGGSAAVLFKRAPASELADQAEMSTPRRVTGHQNRTVILIGVIFLAFLVASLSAIPMRSESFSTFSIVDDYIHPLPWQMRTDPAQPVAVTIEVSSSEQRNASFTMRVVTEEQVIQTIDLGVVQNGAKIQHRILLPPRPHRVQQYEIILYKDGSNFPYRSLYFWLRDLEA
jgi:uncharacterized membrane protein